MAKLWAKGRGKLGPFAPLHGAWLALADTERGSVRCRRTLVPILGGTFLQLDVQWEYGAAGSGHSYEERCIIGAGDGGQVGFWSFTSDGKRAQGVLADVTDLHPEAIGFEADMPAGRARQAYWPEADGGCCWVVEARTTRGWRRFMEHHYRPAD